MSEAGEMAPASGPTVAKRSALTPARRQLDASDAAMLKWMHFPGADAQIAPRGNRATAATSMHTDARRRYSWHVGNRISAGEAVERFKLKGGYRALCRLIDAGIVRGESIEVGRRCIHLVNPNELEEDLANLPECGYPGCTKPAVCPGGGCCGGHSHALKAKGAKRTAETCRRMSEGKRGKPRPDTRERVAAMHANLEQKYRWNVALAEGRARLSTPNAATTMKRRAGGRLGGLIAARERGTGASTVEKRLARTEEGRAQLETFRRAREKHPSWGRPALVAHTGLSDSQVRALLD